MNHFFRFKNGKNFVGSTHRHRLHLNSSWFLILIFNFFPFFSFFLQLIKIIDFLVFFFHSFVQANYRFFCEHFPKHNSIFYEMSRKKYNWVFVMEINEKKKIKEISQLQPSLQKANLLYYVFRMKKINFNYT